VSALVGAGVKGARVIDTDQLILIVVGAHLKAELGDRPAAYRLAELVSRRLEQADDASPFASLRGFRPVVCTDVWYLNQDALRHLPVVCVGGPAANAFAAFLADRLPSAAAVDGVMLVQFDVEAGEAIASCWGVDHIATTRAVEHFAERYLDEFLANAAG